MKYFALVATLLLWSVAGSAQTYSDANVNGNYSFQFVTPQTYSWAKTFTCPTNSTVHFTVFGSQTSSEVSTGVATFDGAGKLTATFTRTGKENPTASANTTSMTWDSSCHPATVNNGHVVYTAPLILTLTGTYSIASTGTGTMTVVASPQSFTYALLLSATNAGNSDTVLVTRVQTNGQPMQTGIGVRQ